MKYNQTNILLLVKESSWKSSLDRMKLDVDGVFVIGFSLFTLQEIVSQNINKRFLYTNYKMYSKLRVI